MSATLSKKSGKGLSNGMLSELSAFLRVKPGHAEQLEAAIQRFGLATHGAGPKAGQRSAGLRDVRFVIFDNGQRLLLITTFETDWDPYIDDAVSLIGIEHWKDWMQHTTEVERLKAAVQGAGGAEQAVKAGSAALKAVLQSAQVQAVYYFNDLNDLTVPQIKKAQRLALAFQRVLDNPEAAQVLQHSALKPLLEQAAD